MGNDGSKPAAGAPSAQQQMAATSAARARSIKLMDNSIRKKLRSTGIQYNMKVVLRGARGVGKSSLLSRLQGGKMPKVHAPTPSIRTATINWHFAKAREDAVKVEVWDVVDKALDDSKSTATVNRAEPGAHSLGALDASMVNVYSNADAIILVCSMADAATRVLEARTYVPTKTRYLFERPDGKLWDTNEFRRSNLMPALRRLAAEGHEGMARFPWGSVGGTTIRMYRRGGRKFVGKSPKAVPDKVDMLGRWKAEPSKMPNVMRQLYDDMDCQDLVMLTSIAP